MAGVYSQQSSILPSPAAPRPKASGNSKPKAYRARGFTTPDPPKVRESLAQILSVKNEIILRTVASSVGIENEYTAVFVFVDNIPRPEYEGTHKLSRSPLIVITIDSHFKGLTILHDSTAEKTIDLIVLPGLGRGHAWGSFKDPQDEYVWLVDSLPEHSPMFRVVTYGYDTTVADSHANPNLEGLASQLRSSLRNIRAKQDTPMVFLAHSLGGLVIKQAIVDMKGSTNSKDRDNFFATYGMYFFGVPNTGMNIEPLKRMIRGQPNEEFIMSLAKDSQLLRNLGIAFSEAFDFADSQIISFYETRVSPSSFYDHETKQWSMTSEEKVFIVDQASATHGRPHEYKAHQRQALDLDHPSLVRYTRNDDNYLMVRSYLEDCEEDAQHVVQRRSQQRQDSTNALQRAPRSDSDLSTVPRCRIRIQGQETVETNLQRAELMGNHGTSTGGSLVINASSQPKMKEFELAWNEGEAHFSKRRANRPEDTWHNLKSAKENFQIARQLLFDLDDGHLAFYKVVTRLTTIELEMSHCHSIKHSRREHHLQNAEAYCKEASVVASNLPSIEGASEEVKHYQEKIHRRRVRLEEDGRERTWFGKRSVQRILAFQGVGASENRRRDV